MQSFKRVFFCFVVLTFSSSANAVEWDRIWSCYGGNAGNSGVIGSHKIAGKEKWRVPLNTGRGSAVVFDGLGNAYYCTEYYFGDPEHCAYLNCINQDSGAKNWQVRVGKTGESWVCLAPCASPDGNVYVATQLDVLNAYRGKDGKLLWRFSPRVKQTRGVGCPVWRRGVVYVAMDDACFAVNAKSGKLIWKRSAYSIQAVSDQYVFLNTEKGTLAVNRNNGNIIWRNKESFENFILNDDFLYVRSENILSCLSVYTGKASWSMKLAEPPCILTPGKSGKTQTMNINPNTELIGSVVLAPNGLIYIISMHIKTGNVYLNKIDTKTRELRKVNILNPDFGLLSLEAYPVFDNAGSIYCQIHSGIVARNLRDGSVVWKKGCEGLIQERRLSVSPEGLLFAVGSGNDRFVYAIE